MADTFMMGFASRKEGDFYIVAYDTSKVLIDYPSSSAVVNSYVQSEFQFYFRDIFLKYSLVKEEGKSPYFKKHIFNPLILSLHDYEQNY
jgi:hypothetical protein